MQTSVITKMERSPSQDIIYVMRREPIPSVALARIVTGLTDSGVVSRDPRRRPAGFEDAKRRLLGKELLNCCGSEVKIIYFSECQLMLATGAYSVTNYEYVRAVVSALIK